MTARSYPGAYLLLSILLSVPFAARDIAAAPVLTTARGILVVTGAELSGPDQKAIEILEARILKRSAVKVVTLSEGSSGLASLPGTADVLFVVGTVESNRLAKTILQQFGATLPTLPNTSQLHPEGFAVRSGSYEGRPCVAVVGTDTRGTLYGIGWLLRAMTYLPDSVRIPELDAREKPAFWLRGASATGPGSRAAQYGDLRPQTPEDQKERMEDLMLLGVNVLYGDAEQMRSYGMMTTFGRTANQMPEGFPKEWGADGGRSNRYVCPSVPDARKALLESFDQMFRTAPSCDFFTTNSGDEGGCRCDRCMPWGGTYIRLLREIAELLHKYHPSTRIMATNQDLTVEGNREIFEFLNSWDSSWLYAIRYGPGADEMQEYIRGDVNPRWFEYEGFGPLGNYLKYMFHELPRTTNISLYSDITHWMQAQYAVEKPDIALAAVYDRRSWNARPKRFHEVAQEILHYAVGDLHYSEGMHDDFNKWFWYQMLWNPKRDAESITRAYCRYWFGPEAEAEAAEAIFLMEETLEQPVLGNPGIAKAVALLHSAGGKIPENLLAIDYRWRIILQKALMDRYIQIKLEQGFALKDAARNILTVASGSPNPERELQQAIEILGGAHVTEEMNTLITETRKLGEESNEITGYRVPAPYLVEDLDLTEIGWWKKVIQEALDSADAARMQRTAKMILHYEDPGEGGFYDDLGWPNDSPHLTHGQALWGFMPFNGPARYSHYNLAYTLGERGVSFTYEGLEPAAEYVVRLSVGAHIPEENAAMLQGVQLEEGIKADGEVLSEGFAIPMNDVVFQEFDIPAAATQDGKLDLELTSKNAAMPITGAYEIWLMRKDKMVW